VDEKGVADYLDRKSRCVQAWRQRGEGPPYYRLGTGPKASVRYDLDEVDAWLRERRVEHAA
jgi:phage terminase Nu1 subunit (DNA packaging protein)